MHGLWIRDPLPSARFDYQPFDYQFSNHSGETCDVWYLLSYIDFFLFSQDGVFIRHEYVMSSRERLKSHFTSEAKGRVCVNHDVRPNQAPHQRWNVRENEFVHLSVPSLQEHAVPLCDCCLGLLKHRDGGVVTVSHPHEPHTSVLIIELEIRQICREMCKI